MERNRTRRGRRRLWVVGVLAVVVAAAAVVAGITITRAGAAAAPVLTAAVAREDVTRSVSGTGSLVDEVTYSVAADGTATVAERAGASAGATGGSGTASGTTTPSSAATTTSVSVEAGQRVTRGQRLARVEQADGGTETVDSPVAGHVRSVTAAPHATAGEIATIGTGRVLAALAISENQIAEVRAGQRVAVTLAAGTASTTGVVDQVEQVPDDSSGALRYTVLVQLDRVPVGARIGMTATGAITTARAAGVLALPAAAIEVHGGALGVRVEGEGGRSRLVPVRIGLVGDSLVEVTSGVHAGERVVTGRTGEIAATTRRLGPPSSASGSSAAPSAASR